MRRSGTQSERKHQKEISQLGHCRVSDQEFQSLLSQGEHAAEQNRRSAKRSEQLRSREARQSRHYIEPDADDDEERSLHNQRREHSAGWGRRASVSRRQPKVQRGKRGLGEK